MAILFYVVNGLVMPPAAFFVVNYYRYKGKSIDFRKLPISISIVSITMVITSLQFFFPEIITALDRNKTGLLSGEIWRLITPLFIQPMGIWQCVFNGVFLILFLPIGEHFYKRHLLIIYFGAGLLGQLFNYHWEKGGGGSSTAIYGVIGSLFMYIILYRKVFPEGYIFLSIAGFMGATVLCFFKDGHAPSLLFGGLLSLMILRGKLIVNNPIDDKKINFN